MKNKKNQDVVSILIEDELNSSIKKHGEFHSTHEAYAVLLEEVEEMEDELKIIKEYMLTIWNYIKANSNGVIANNLEVIEESAHRVIEETIQISAMAKKFQMLMEKIK
jgi:hypothetical protein